MRGESFRDWEPIPHWWWQKFPAYPDILTPSPVPILALSSFPNFSCWYSWTCHCIMKKKHQKRCLLQKANREHVFHQRLKRSQGTHSSDRQLEAHSQNPRAEHELLKEPLGESPSSATHQLFCQQQCVTTRTWSSLWLLASYIENKVDSLYWNFQCWRASKFLSPRRQAPFSRTQALHPSPVSPALQDDIHPPDGPSTSAPELLMCTGVSKNPPCFSSA